MGAIGQRAIEGKGGRHGADQDQHDQSHALLPVVGAVSEADAGAGEDQQATDPLGRRLVGLRRTVQFGLTDEHLHNEQ